MIDTPQVTHSVSEDENSFSEIGIGISRHALASGSFSNQSVFSFRNRG